MSLMSLISTGTSQTTTTSNTGTAAQVQALIDARTAAAKTAASGSTASGNGVTISSAALIAAAAAKDNAKDFATVTSETRATLDAQYAAAKTAGKAQPAPDLDELSGRALAAIVLNKNKDFSAGEVAAAKMELRTRTREQFTATVGGGNSLSSIASYNQLLVSQYDAMSAEEREALGWNADFRSSASAFVGTASQSSLFDRLGDIGDDY